MITETEARELLAQAARTIDVPSARSVPTADPVRRRWTTPLIAAASVMSAIAAGAILMSGSDSGPSTAATVLPGLVGWKADQADEALTSAGFHVVRERRGVCGRSLGRVVRTVPAANAEVRPGATIKLLVSAPDTHLCFAGRSPDAQLLRLLDFAGHRGPAPRFADRVRVVVDSEIRTITGAQAADWRTWGEKSALGLFQRDMNLYSEAGTVWMTLQGTNGYPGCGDPYAVHAEPARLVERFAVVPQEPAKGCTLLEVYTTGGPTRLINEIVLSAWKSTEDEIDEDLAREFLEFARDAGPAPKFSGQVRLYLGNRGRGTMSAEQARTRSWPSACRESDENCTPSALDVLSQTRYQPVLVDSFGSCVRQLGPRLRPQQTHGFHHVTWGVAEPRSCSEDWAVELWYDDAGRITAVNLLLGAR